MGLFDKLFGSDKGGVSLKNALQDETVKTYYQMIYDMKMHLGWYGNETADDTSRAKRYVEMMLGGPCQEEKFKMAVELTNLARTDYPQTKLEIELKELNKTLKTCKKYVCSEDVAYRLCYKELIAEIKVDYESILDIIRENTVDCEIFGEGLKRKILEKYDKTQDSGVVKGCLYTVIKDSFLAENILTKSILFALLTDIFEKRVATNDPYHFLSALHKFALSALHFEKHGTTPDNYAPITDEAYREHILKCKNYLRDLEKHPFDKEERIQKILNDIKTAEIFAVNYSSYKDSFSTPCVCWLHRMDDYFADALANYAWKFIAQVYPEEYQAGTVDSVAIANMLYDFFKI